MLIYLCNSMIRGKVSAKLIFKCTNTQMGGLPIKGIFVLILIVFTVLCMPAFGQTTAVDWNSKGIALYDQKKYDEAIQAFDKAIDIDPRFEEAWYYKGVALFDQGKYDDANQALDKATDIDPQDADAWREKGFALTRLGLTVESFDAFEKADELGGSTGTSTPETTTNSNAAGTNILDHSMASNVDESTSKVITRSNTFYNTDSKAYSWLNLGNVGAGTVEWRWYSPDGNLYKTGSVDIPPNPSGGNWPSYYVWYYIDITGDYPSGLLGDWHVDVLLNGQTLTEYFSIQGYQQQTTAKDWFDKGIALQEQGKYDEAVQAYNKAIEIDPQHASAWTNKGVALADQSEYDEAIQAYNKAIEIDPQHASAWTNKGVALNYQGKHDEAITAYEKAIEIDPQDASAWTNKGIALQEQGKYDEAVQAYNKSIEIKPQFAVDWSDWNNKGNALQAQGKYDEAIKAYDKAIDLHPQYSLAWNNKGNALNRLGLTPEANAAYAKAKELGYTG